MLFRVFRVATSSKDSGNLDRVDAIIEAATTINENARQLHIEQGRRIKEQAAQRVRVLNSGMRRLDTIESDIRSDVDLMVAKARTEAAAWRLEVRRKEQEAVEERQQRNLQREELVARDDLIDSLMRQLDDPELATPFMDMREVTRFGYPDESTFQALALLEMRLQERFADQSEDMASRIGRTRWEFSIAKVIRWSMRITCGFVILVLLIDQAIHVFHLKLWYIVVLILFVAWITGDTLVGKFHEKLDAAYRTWRLKRKIIYKVATFKATLATWQVSLETFKSRLRPQGEEQMSDGEITSAQGGPPGAKPESPEGGEPEDGNEARG